MRDRFFIAMLGTSYTPVLAGERWAKETFGAAVETTAVLAKVEDAQAGCRLKAFLFERYVAFQATPFSWAVAPKSLMSRASRRAKFSHDANVRFA
jgi:hypothetical protein